ncbi:Retrovirus-related Pol polyprotein from transposon TNT 1-94 [Rhizoctonia solani]|uniref:Retrovirus-related Pol polyprotein from transposon TNT 1-94 n=1 Tax=Rhizoctonia solani TaxID=456999 RepID=A0A8H8SWP3_9AGAM|nr:Retrovirus-related Pol polyprotein from transposon TNT 1-94 [Rhizoctonia solani]QRW20579.1 Retrovirus-related Pol polyprotein from transposon TNT 1-94 [Rhizoctonia solani]
MMLKSNAPKFLWNKAIATFWMTPFESFWGKKPNVSTLRPWGSKCYILDQTRDQSKLDTKAFQAIFVGILEVQGKSWRYYKSGSNRILHSRNITFPRVNTVSEEPGIDQDWGDTVALPAEGEMTHANSTAEQPKEPARTGGVHTVSKEEKSDSNEPADIKSEPKIEQKASNKSTKLTHNNVLKPYTTCSHSAMRIDPSATTNALQQLNALTSGTNNAGVQTCSWNPNVAPIKLNSMQGGITLKIQCHDPCLCWHVS